MEAFFDRGKKWLIWRFVAHSGDRDAKAVFREAGLAVSFYTASTHCRPIVRGYGFAMKHLSVEILADKVVIGTADLRPSDPSMGVAYATFQPSPAYVVDLHARASEKRVLDSNPTPLGARTSAGTELECAGVDLG